MTTRTDEYEEKFQSYGNLYTFTNSNEKQI